jgi:hypothetical protein
VKIYVSIVIGRNTLLFAEHSLLIETEPGIYNSEADGVQILGAYYKIRGIK